MMIRTSAVVSLFSLAALIALSPRADAQTAAVASPHVLVIKLVLKTGALPYAFEPATTNAQPGDTLRFTEASGALHNVRFTKQAPGAKLGSAATTPYLTAKGQTYDVVVDQRFAAGTYEFVCDPHAAIGMKGTLIVK
jgi:plastocyanin